MSEIIKLEFNGIINEKLNGLILYSKKDNGVKISKTEIMQIAIQELLGKIKTKKDLKRALQKYGYLNDGKLKIKR